MGWFDSDSSGWDSGPSGFDSGFGDSPSTATDTTDKFGSWGDLNNSLGYDSSKSGWNDYSGGSGSWNDYGSKYDWNSDFTGLGDSSGTNWGDFNFNDVGLLNYNRPNSMFDLSAGSLRSLNPQPSGYTTSDNYTTDGFYGLSGTPSSMSIRSPTTTDQWGREVNITPAAAKYKSPYDITYNDMQDEFNNRNVYGRYQNNPLTQLSSSLQTVGKYGSLVNPSAAIAGPVGSLLDMGVRSHYGLPNDYSSLGGSLANAAVGGGIGGMTLGNLTSAGIKSYQNTGEFGPSFGEGMGRGLTSMVLGQFGPLGQLANMGLGDWLKTGVGAYNAYKTNQMVKDFERGNDVTGQLANLQQSLYANKASNPVYKADLDQARNEAIAALSAQGKLGSGSRVTAATRLAEESANRQFQTYAQNYLQNMGNQYATQSQNNLNNLKAKLAQQQMNQKYLMDFANEQGWL